MPKTILKVPGEPMSLELQFGLVAAEGVGGSFAQHAVRGGRDRGVTVGEVHLKAEGRRQKDEG